MGSTRLPGKTLEPLGETTVLGSVIDRLEMASSVGQVILATTTEDEDDAIVGHFTHRLPVVRGDHQDVLSRFVKASELADHETLLRVTADCPFIDPLIVDLAVETVTSHAYDYVGTDIDGRFLHGLDVEAFSHTVLVASLKFAVSEPDREHVTPAIYRNPDQFSIGAIPAPEWARRPDLRLTIDEPEDLALARAILSIDPSLATKSAEKVIALLDANPPLRAINAVVEHKISPVEGFRAADTQ